MNGIDWLELANAPTPAVSCLRCGAVDCLCDLEQIARLASDLPHAQRGHRARARVAAQIRWSRRARSRP